MGQVAGLLMGLMSLREEWLTGQVAGLLTGLMSLLGEWLRLMVGQMTLTESLVKVIVELLQSLPSNFRNCSALCLVIAVPSFSAGAACSAR